MGGAVFFRTSDEYTPEELQPMTGNRRRQEMTRSPEVLGIVLCVMIFCM